MPFCCAGGRHQPFYHVLVDSRHRPGQTTYVAQVKHSIRYHSPAKGTSLRSPRTTSYR